VGNTEKKARINKKGAPLFTSEEEGVFYRLPWLIGGFIVDRWTKFLLAALLLTGFILPTNAASADIENVPWREFRPSTQETQRGTNSAVLAHRDGIRIRVDEGGYCRRWGWSIDNDVDRRANNWQIRATFEREEGASGVMFGLDPDFIYVVLDDDYLYLMDCPSGCRVLQQVQLRPEHQRRQSVVLTLALERDTGTIKCFIDGAEYVFDMSGIELPLVGRFGIVGASRGNTPSRAVFKFVERRWSN